MALDPAILGQTIELDPVNGQSRKYTIGQLLENLDTVEKLKAQVEALDGEKKGFQSKADQTLAFLKQLEGKKAGAFVQLAELLGGDEDLAEQLYNVATGKGGGDTVPTNNPPKGQAGPATSPELAALQKQLNQITGYLQGLEAEHGPLSQVLGVTAAHTNKWASDSIKAQIAKGLDKHPVFGKITNRDPWVDEVHAEVEGLVDKGMRLESAIDSVVKRKATLAQPLVTAAQRTGNAATPWGLLPMGGSVAGPEALGVLRETGERPKLDPKAMSERGAMGSYFDKALAYERAQGNFDTEE